MSVDIHQLRLDTAETGYFGLDMGGTLCKITFWEPKMQELHGQNLQDVKTLMDFIGKSKKYGSTGTRDENLQITTAHGRFHFIVFETRRMQQAMDMILKNGIGNVIRSVSATGGGAFKYETLFQSAGEQGIQIRKKDEIKCLIKGLDFLLQRVDGEAFEVEDTTGNKIPISFHQDESNLYPFLLVNVGTGVSIIKVNSPTQFERISGSGIGGGTYWGLVKLLTKVTTFEESLNLSLQGDERNVNMTVGDIYGGRDYDSLGLNADMTASFFAKFISKERDEIVTNADICKGLLSMVTNNIGQIANLCAAKHDIRTIFFAGNFMRGNSVSMHALSLGSKFWSQGKTRALFLKHEGYFGSLGALLQ